MKDWKTTLSAVVTGVAWLLAAFGFEVSAEVQNAIVVVGLFVTGLLAKDAKGGGQ